MALFSEVAQRVELCLFDAERNETRVELTEVEEAARQVQVNVLSVAGLLHHVLPGMRQRGHGRVVLVSSIAAQFSSPMGAWYHASKAALESLGDTLRQEVSCFGVDVTINQVDARLRANPRLRLLETNARFLKKEDIPFVPDLIVMDNNYFTFFEQSQTSIKRYTDETKANAGFVSLKYKGADVIFDGASGIPVNTSYFLNTDYLELVVHKDADMTVMDELKPYNQDAAVVPVLWMGNMTVTNRALQGVMKA